MVEMNVKTTNSNHNVMMQVNFQLVLVMKLAVKIVFLNLIKKFNLFFSKKTGACCDNGSCHLSLGTSGCNDGVFQGFGSECNPRSCPVGNVCCQDVLDDVCLTGHNAVEQCTQPGQFAAQTCQECYDRFADLTLSISTPTEQVSLSGSELFLT